MGRSLCFFPSPGTAAIGGLGGDLRVVLAASVGQADVGLVVLVRVVVVVVGVPSASHDG